MLDETLRRRVAEIAAADSGCLDDAASERIVRRLAAEGPRVVRWARRTRFALMAAGPVLAVAAGAALLVRHSVGKGTREEATVTLPAEAAIVSACARRAVPVGAGFVAGSDGARLDLGMVATAVAEPNADVRVAEVAPCRTVIALGMGRVTVHAKDLGGGELRVRARDGEVTVHGTIFAVAQTNDSLVVEVAEGRVGVKDRTGEHWVGAAERLLVSAVGVAQGTLTPDRVRALRGAVGAPLVVGLETLVAVPPQEPPQSHPRGIAEAAPSQPRTRSSGVEAVELASAVETAQEAPAAPAARAAVPADLLGQAEQARHAGDYAGARDLYRRAAGGQGPTGEAAWVALARMELSLGHAALAREATKQRQEHFGQGTLSPESQWIDVRTYRQTGDLGRARALAEELVRRWPSSPQARAAAQWLSTD
jgi:hypothetical protein